MNILADMYRFAEMNCHDPDGSEPLFSAANIFMRLDTDEDSAYIAEFKDRIIISFQGSKNLKAWCSDFDAFALTNDLSLEKGTIHKGFYEGWTSYKQPIDDYFRQLLGVTGNDFSSCKKKVFITGHSRGGTLGPLCARHLAKNRNLECNCISFAGAAFGTKECREEMEKLPIYHTRVVYGYDIVPTSFIIGMVLKHSGNLEWLPSPIWHKWFVWRRVMDHFYSTYVKGLITYCQKHGDKEGELAMREILKQAKP